MDPKTPFRFLSQEEFERLTLEERMQYLHRAMTDIRQKLAQTREEIAATSKIGKGTKP
jgi:hypothetical protein